MPGQQGRDFGCGERGSSRLMKDGQVRAVGQDAAARADEQSAARPGSVLVRALAVMSRATSCSRSGSIGFAVIDQPYASLATDTS